jgi:uncharacterized membrane protein
MMSFLSSIAQSIASPPQRHAMLIHLPIALAFVIAGLMVFFLISRGKSTALRRIVMALLLVGGLLSFLAAQAGSAAMEMLTLPLTPEATQTLESHEFMGNLLWMFYLVTAGLIALTTFKMRLVRYPAVLLASLAVLILMGWVMVVAHDGGNLVYRHGAGVPASPNNTVIVTP